MLHVIENEYGNELETFEMDYLGNYPVTLKLTMSKLMRCLFRHWKSNVWKNDMGNRSNVFELSLENTKMMKMRF